MAVDPTLLEEGVVPLEFWATASKIRAQLDSLEERCRYLIEEYQGEYPGLAGNDRLLLLLYLRDFNRLDVPNIWLERASLREHSRIDNPWCILRALRRVKRDYMTDEEKTLSEFLEAAWRDVLSPHIDQAWDYHLAKELASRDRD